MREFSRRSVRSAAVLVVVAVAGLTSFFGAAAADAHSRLVSSEPSANTVLSTAPGQVKLTFNEAIGESFAVLTVVGPDGNFWQDGDPVVSGTTVSVKLRPLGPTGTYTINYRVASADGHPVEGQREFTMSVAGPGTPGPKATVSGDSDSGMPVWPFIAVGAVVLVAGIGVVVWMARPRTKR